MRWHSLALATLWLVVAAPAWCVEFPYTAYVNSADVYVRSGPGRDYYPTDKLQKGEKVEIYRHDPGGWYAIRPPKGSYSWVSARNLDLEDNVLAVVNTRRAVARVGSAFSDVRDVIQVRLDKGEKVELVEPPSSDSPWRKIAPPAGEFRWVFSKFVDEDPPADLDEDDRNAGYRRRREFDDSEEIDAAPRDRDVRQASGARERVPDDPRHSVTSKPQRVDLSSEPARRRELERIDLELSTMVAQDIAAWSLGELIKRAETVLGESQDATERGRARVVLGQLAKFDDIKTRHDALRRVQADSMPTVAGARAVDPRFDGVGRLTPVVSQKAGGPQYALVDSSNAVVSFVTPAPGVNLRPYVDKQVGVSGQCGYMTDLKRQHINVQRVSLLDVQRR